jgi:hypothetical protein
MLKITYAIIILLRNIPKEHRVFKNKFKNFLSKHKVLIYIILALPVAGGVIFQFIHYFLSPLSYLSWSKFHLIVIPFAELLLLFASFDIYTRLKEKKYPDIGWQLVFLITATNLLVINALAAFYQGRTGYPLVHAILSMVPVLEGLLFLSMLVCFWMGFRKPLIRTWNTFSLVKDEEKEGSQKKVWLTAAFLLTCFMVGLGLRLYNLGGFPPFVDEYAQIRTAIAIFKGQPVDYTRSLLTVSLPVYLSYRIFGMSLWSGRLPMVLINMLAIFPLYFLGKKINKEVGYICVVLFVFSPWIIAVSRNVREYAVVPFFFYFDGLLLIDMLDWDGQSPKSYLQRHFYRIALAGLILGYAIFDYASVFKIIVALYVVFGILAILKLLKSNPSRWLRISVIVSGAACILILRGYSGLIQHYFLHSEFSFKIAFIYWYSLVNNNVRQWYFIKDIGYAVILIGGFFAIRAALSRYKKNEFVALFCYLVFTVDLVYLTFFLVSKDVTEIARYGVLMEYWYLIVVATVLFIAYSIFRDLIGKGYQVFTIVVALALFFNFPAITMVLSYKGGETLQVSGESHYLIDSSYQYLVGHLTTKDVLVTDVLQTYDEISGNQFPPVKVVRFDGSDPFTIIQEYPQGWIAVSSNAHPERTALKFSDFNYAGKQIQYIGEMEGVYLWKW